MSYPSSIDSFTGFTSSETLQVAQHASQHNQEQSAIVAIETKMGTGASTPINNQFLVGNGSGSSAWRALTTSDIYFSPLSVLQQVYPVGCIYTEVTGVNPGTTFGFGTWIQYAKGQVLVGQSPGDPNFGTVGNSGGEATHVLTSGEMPSHTHTDSGHTHGGVAKFEGSGGDTIFSSGTNALGATAISGSGTANLSNTGSGLAHNNLQPYIVVYIWERTA